MGDNSRLEMLVEQVKAQFVEKQPNPRIQTQEDQDVYQSLVQPNRNLHDENIGRELGRNSFQQVESTPTQNTLDVSLSSPQYQSQKSQLVQQNHQNVKQMNHFHQDHQQYRRFSMASVYEENKQQHVQHKGDQPSNAIQRSKILPCKSIMHLNATNEQLQVQIPIVVNPTEQTENSLHSVDTPKQSNAFCTSRLLQLLGLDSEPQSSKSLQIPEYNYIQVSPLKVRRELQLEPDTQDKSLGESYRDLLHKYRELTQNMNQNQIADSRARIFDAQEVKSISTKQSAYDYTPRFSGLATTRYAQPPSFEPNLDDQPTLVRPQVSNSHLELLSKGQKIDTEVKPQDSRIRIMSAMVKSQVPQSNDIIQPSRSPVSNGVDVNAKKHTLTETSFHSSNSSMCDGIKFSFNPSKQQPISNNPGPLRKRKQIFS